LQKPVQQDRIGFKAAPSFNQLPSEAQPAYSAILYGTVVESRRMTVATAETMKYAG
jgi:hypothetical protein